MNRPAILHIPDSRYCFATGLKELVIRLRMAKEDENIKVSLIYAGKYEFGSKQDAADMGICFTDALYNYYEIRLKLKDVRLAYVFLLEEDGRKYYFSEDGVTESYKFEEGFYNFFQMPYINGNDVPAVVDWMRSAVFYQIFVDRFYRGKKNKRLDYINMEWGDIPTPKSFAGGDIPGITQKLDYIKGLGANTIYLTPVFQSISNHKYDISDYRTVDEQFGTNEDLKELVKTAHEKGIRIVLDAVFNHCSDRMYQFQDVLKKGKESEYFDWFFIDGDLPDQEKLNYECFGACNYMPKLNTANPNVQDFLLDIACSWIREADIDGWRLDVSDEVSHEFWRKFRQVVKKEKPQCVIIGENWHDAYPYLQGDQYDSIMNYSFTKACLDYFARESLNSEQMAEKLSGNYMRNKEQINYMMLNLLDSHDTHRFFTEVQGDKDKLLAALALLVMFPGAPCIYYGTEICMEGGYDPDSRRCFDWDENHWDKEVLAMLRELTALRNDRVLQYGELKISARDEMLCLKRCDKNSELVLYLNPTAKDKTLPAGEMKKRCSNGFCDGKLKAKGFLIAERRKEEDET